MPTLPTQSFNQIVTNTIAGIQGRASKLLNFSIGSTLRAIVEGFAGLFLWFQAMVLQLLTAIRLSTSTGLDVDTWTADYMPVVTGTSSPRLGAAAATGFVTFSRFTAVATTCLIPIGATVQTTDTTQNYTVVIDTADANYNPTLGGYVLASLVSSIRVPIQCTVGGVGGNVSPNTITSMTSPIIGIDSVNNLVALINGTNFESDIALKARFVAYIASLSKATDGAIRYSIISVQNGLQCQIFDNLDPSGATDYGMVTVYVDDGSGALPSTVLTAATNAAQLVRAASVRMGVFAATPLFANIVMIIITAPGYYHPTVVAQVVAALTSYINGIGLGTTPALGQLSYMKLAQIAFEASPGVTDIQNYTLNAMAADLVPVMGQTIKAGTLIIS